MMTEMTSWLDKGLRESRPAKVSNSDKNTFVVFVVRESSGTQSKCLYPKNERERAFSDPLPLLKRDKR